MEKEISSQFRDELTNMISGTSFIALFIPFSKVFRLSRKKDSGLFYCASFEIILVTEFATMSLRTLILAYRDYPSTDYDRLSNTENAIPESDLVMIAMVGIKDPCRPGVPDAVKRCQQVIWRACLGLGIAIIRCIYIFIYLKW